MRYYISKDALVRNAHHTHTHGKLKQQWFTRVNLKVPGKVPRVIPVHLDRVLASSKSAHVVRVHARHCVSCLICPHFYERQRENKRKFWRSRAKLPSYSAFVYSDRREIKVNVLPRLQVFAETVYMQMFKGCEHNDTWH